MYVYMWVFLEISTWTNIFPKSRGLRERQTLPAQKNKLKVERLDGGRIALVPGVCYSIVWYAMLCYAKGTHFTSLDKKGINISMYYDDYVLETKR